MKPKTKITIHYTNGEDSGTQEIEEKFYYSTKKKLENLGYTVTKV